MIAESLRRGPQTELEWLGPLPVRSSVAHVGWSRKAGRINIIMTSAWPGEPRRRGSAGGKRSDNKRHDRIVRQGAFDQMM